MMIKLRAYQTMLDTIAISIQAMNYEPSTTTMLDTIAISIQAMNHEL